MMKITFDPAKNARNIVERGLSFERVLEGDWDNADVVEDTRKDYGERRYSAMVMIAGRLHNVIFTPRSDTMHIISFRKANNREVTLYEAQR